MDIYAEIGVEPVINASGPVTKLDGSLMPPEVVEAMASASRSFVDLDELHLAAGKRIAAMIGVEAAHVCSGAAAGIALMAAACMAGSDKEKIAQLPDTQGMRDTFIAQRAHRNSFDQAIRVAGGRIVTVEADAGALAAAIDDNTAALYYTVGAFTRGESLPLPEAAAIAHEAGVPLIVDAAAQVPPVEHFTRYLKEGSDLVTFSGGKAVRGPQPTGLILGRADLIEACRLNDNPNMAIGRPMKAGKEEIAGLVKAVELYLAKDHAREMQLWEERIRTIAGTFAGEPRVSVSRRVPYGIAQQGPTAAISWDEEKLGITLGEVARRLKEGKPRIVVRLMAPEADYPAEIRVYPDSLQEGEAEIIAQRLRQILVGEAEK